MIKILGVAGSLRKASYNRALLREAKDLVPQGAQLEIFDLDGLPVYNQDNDSNMPDKVKELKASIKAADAILFVTPEFNHSVSGVLKNAIDWASRPSAENVWTGKPAAVMSSSSGAYGGERARLHLKQIMGYLDMPAVNKPEVAIPFNKEKFDENLRLKDEKAKEKIKELLVNLVALTKRFQQ